MSSDGEKTLSTHLFICTNHRKDRGSCGALGSDALREAVKNSCKAVPELKGKIRVNAAGCLGHCERGITAVFYPQAVWRFELDSDSTETLVNEAVRLVREAEAAKKT